MVEEIKIERLMELYLDTIQKCGTYLLDSEDKVIEYNIFEEFDIGVISFLHTDNLIKLREAELICDKVMEKSSLLRNMVIKLQHSDKWNVQGVKNSYEWKNVLKLADEIKVMTK